MTQVATEVECSPQSEPLMSYAAGAHPGDANNCDARTVGWKVSPYDTVLPESVDLTTQ